MYFGDCTGKHIRLGEHVENSSGESGETAATSVGNEPTTLRNYAAAPARLWFHERKINFD